MKPEEFFPKEAARLYDEKNSKLAPISDCLHFLTGLVFRDLPERSRILCVGAGTGAEILSLARTFPDWKFVASEPSLPMLEVCRERMQKAGIANRCEFVHGYVHDVPDQDFDVVLSMLVGHFVSRDERASFYGEMTKRVRKGGHLVNAEISFDLDSPQLPSMVESWKGVQMLMGATPESLANLPTALRNVLTILPPEKIETLLRKNGLSNPIRFFQALMIHGWYGKKEA